MSRRCLALPRLPRLSLPALRSALLACLCLGALTPSAGWAQGARSATPPSTAPTAELLSLADVRPGMTGYGLTVFSGVRPERFAVRVIGVLRQFQPQLDIILIVSDDERLKHSGIAAGMSGSPIYLEGKLAGALAYGWSFAKDPIAGVTPIGNILRELRRPSRPPHPTTTPAGSGPIGTAGNRDPGAGSQAFVAPLPDKRVLRAVLGEGGGAIDRPSLRRLLPGSVSANGDAGPQLTRVAVPLAIGGMGERAIEELRSLLSPYGLMPLQAGGGGRTSNASGDADPPFVAGGAIAVQMARGDVSMNGTGTVTYVEGSRVAAFGHPMLGAGELHFPVATAEILTFMSSQAMSFKMSMPLREVGMLTQDRPSCIIADTRERATVLPVDISVFTQNGNAAPAGAGLTPLPTGKAALKPERDKSFHIELGLHRALTPILVSSVANNAIQTVVPDVAEAVVEIQSRITARGFPVLEHSDFLYAGEGISNRMINTSTGMKQLQELFGNPFAPIQVDRVELRLGVSYRADLAEIVSIALPGDELEPDTRPSLYVTLRPYAGPPFVRAIPFEVPRWLAGQALKIEVQAGHQVKPEQAPAENLNDFVDNLRKVYSARTLVVTLNTLEEGVMLRGRLVPALPASVIATLRPAGGSRRGEPYKRVGRQLIEMDTVLAGKSEITVLVRDEVR